MTLKELCEEYGDDFIKYADRILDSYFGNLFVSYKNEIVVYCNQHMAESVYMSKDELMGMSIEELRSKKLWLRSLSKELYDDPKPFNAYNVSKWGKELFTHVEPIFNDEGEVIMSAQYSIPKSMLNEFSDYIDREKKTLKNYKGITDFLTSFHEGQDDIIMNSAAAKKTFHEAAYVADMDGTVLIFGETGSGKDVMANYIYRNSHRKDGPFVPVNCSAIPMELMESEFFGYEKGAFTGALNTGKPGLFEMANNGTLFLDEIGELPLPMQAKLLRVLETGEVMRLGGTKIIKTDVRIIAATNRNLIEMIKEQRFREDLFYRLNVMPIFMPALRGRKEDIIPLAQSFLDRYNRKYNLHRELSSDIKEGLLSYSWPGNIRELRNVIERYIISGRMMISSATPIGSNEHSEGFRDQKTEMPLHEAAAAFEKQYIKTCLQECDGAVTKAARKLGIHRSLLYKKMQKYGIEKS
ncbi:MAG: sigma 54-interacting transcriptional regulator [Lachnospiraceae bacterium]|nr:sigma 54-interacting transcriptional regulator [Lachnospiraceae bacterium]